jgi:hypothetical protein
METLAKSIEFHCNIKIFASKVILHHSLTLNKIINLGKFSIKSNLIYLNDWNLELITISIICNLEST